MLLKEETHSPELLEASNRLWYQYIAFEIYFCSIVLVVLDPFIITTLHYQKITAVYAVSAPCARFCLFDRVSHESTRTALDIAASCNELGK